MAVELWSRIERQLGTNLPLATLFQFPTVEKLAQQLEQSDPKQICPSLVEIQAGQKGNDKHLYSLSMYWGMAWNIAVPWCAIGG
jgi:hypothetical protein